MVEYVYKRCLNSLSTDGVAVLTSNEVTDNALAAKCKEKKIPYYRGALNDVLSRFINGAYIFKADIICRVCGDSPFVDVNLIDKLFKRVIEEKLDFGIVGNSLNGFLSEVITTNALKKIGKLAVSPENREHVTLYLRRNINKFRYCVVEAPTAPACLQHFSLTVDYPEDLKTVNKVLASGLSGYNFDSSRVIEILERIKNDIHGSRVSFKD